MLMLEDQQAERARQAGIWQSRHAWAIPADLLLLLLLSLTGGHKLQLQGACRAG
jgi:hypothetical protein